MKNWVIFGLFFLGSLALRYPNFAYHAPFDWDQARDYRAVTQIAHGELVVLGPVAKGEGGFYLGSLYYYLLFPAYKLMHGSLTALPLTSIILDSLVPGVIYLLLARFLGRRVALATALFWACSTLLVGASRISWNVILVPLWTVLTLSSLLARPSPRQLYLLALLTGVSAHIHVAAIPIIPLIIVFNYKNFFFSWKNYLMAFCVGLMPVLPLIFFDLTHSFQNLHLFLFQFKSQASAPVQIIPMLFMAITKLGKVVSGLFLARFADNLVLGVISVLLAVFSLRDRRTIVRLSAQLMLVSFALVLALHDYHFPEYYFAPSYLALIILFLSQLLRLLPRLGWLLLLLSLGFNLQAIHLQEPDRLSLGYKQELVDYMVTLPAPRDIQYQFDPGRDGGLRELVSFKQITFDSNSRDRLIITDRVRYPAYIDGELATDLFQAGDLKIARDIVE